MTVSFYTLGCKVNQYESQSIAECFERRGYKITDKNGDIIIVNSCTVTAESDRKTRQALRRFKRQNAASVIVLAGCMPQAHPETADALPEADIVVGNSNPAIIPDLVEEFLRAKKRAVCVQAHLAAEKYNTPPVSDFGEHTRAFMKIEDGCDRYCTYCLIPFARGCIRSRAPADITAEAERLASAGYKEIVLVGINLSSYGKGEGYSLSDAVAAVSAVDKIERIRLGSLEPDLMSDALLDSLASNKKLCGQFHLSLQSGCDETLKRMNRKYDTAFYYDLVCRIRSKFKDAAITTDIMVGFAGETQQEFEKSLEFAKKVGFAKSHIFAYSRRKGTFADKYPNQVSEQEKAERSRRMIELTNQSEKEFLKASIGRSATVLFETKQQGMYFGYTEGYLPVRVHSSRDICGECLQVYLKELKEDYILGEIK